MGWFPPIIDPERWVQPITKRNSPFTNFYKRISIMHHMTKKSLMAKYAPMVAEGKSPIEIKNAIVENEADKALTAEEVDEVVLSLFDEAAAKENVAAEQQPQQPAVQNQQVSAATKETPAIVGEEPKRDLAIDSSGNTTLVPKGKKLYDIYQGQWWPTEIVTGYDGKDHVIEWEFRPEGKPKMTNVPCEPNRADEFNLGKRLRAGKTPTEQMIEVGAFNKKIIDKLPNPNVGRRIN
jgi:hypothetical protein